MREFTILNDAVCGRSTTETLAAGVNKVVANDQNTIFNAFFAAECARRDGRFDLATEILDAIKRQPIAKDGANIKAAIGRHKKLIGINDRLPLPEDQIAQHPPRLPEPIKTHPVFARPVPSSESTNNTGDHELPPIWIRGWNFTKAMARYVGSGRKRCTQKQIDKRLAICQACPHLLPSQHCSKCGCSCNEENKLMNKLALASSECPIGKWTTELK